MSYTHLTSKQRVELSVLLRAGLKQKEIARVLAKHPSTISRELGRNATDNRTGYDARIARRRTKQRRIKANQRFRKIENNLRLEQYIVLKLKQYWSPEQTAGRLRRRYGKTIVCQETIYQYIYNRNPELKEYLRSQKGKYRRRHGTKIREKKREEAKKRRIDERPEVTEKRQRLGDWEGDFMFGRERKLGILVHVDRKSGYTLADKMNSLLSPYVRETTINRFQKISKNKRYSITYDNDSRFAEHELTERAIKALIYFANPYHSWERGTSENTNGLLRQFFPKRSCFAKITQEDVKKAICLLNTRPRKRLHYLTPSEVFTENCALD